MFISIHGKSMMMPMTGLGRCQTFYSVWSLCYSAQCLKSQGLIRLGCATFSMKKGARRNKPYAILKQVNKNIWHKTIPGKNTISILTFEKKFNTSIDYNKIKYLLQDFLESIHEQKSPCPRKCFSYKKPHMRASLVAQWWRIACQCRRHGFNP